MDNIVEILKLGISGFAFLLAYMGYRLLRNEQSKAKPNTKTLGMIWRFLWLSVVLAIVVGGFGVVDTILRRTSAQSVDSEPIRLCRANLEIVLSRLDATATTEEDSETSESANFRAFVRAKMEMCLAGLEGAAYE